MNTVHNWQEYSGGKSSSARVVVQFKGIRKASLPPSMGHFFGTEDMFFCGHVRPQGGECSQLKVREIGMVYGCILSVPQG